MDVDPQTFNIDPKAIEAAVTPKQKRLFMHLFGQAANMEAINALAEKAQALCSRRIWAFGANSTYMLMDKSKNRDFRPCCNETMLMKNLGAYGDGGAIFTNDDELAHFIRGIVNHGMYKRYADVVGVNSRLDAMQAAVLNVKLKYLDYYNERRKEAAIHGTCCWRTIPIL